MGGICPPVGTVYPAELPMLPAPPPVLAKTSFDELIVRERGMIVGFFGNDIFGKTSLRKKIQKDLKKETSLIKASDQREQSDVIVYKNINKEFLLLKRCSLKDTFHKDALRMITY